MNAGSLLLNLILNNNLFVPQCSSVGVPCCRNNEGRGGGGVRFERFFFSRDITK